MDFSLITPSDLIAPARQEFEWSLDRKALRGKEETGFLGGKLDF